MNFIARLNPIRQTSRKLWAVCCLALYGVACAGISLPVPGSVIDHSIPFPCQGHNCGCNSAEQCWNNCCCMTLAQRLAWARENQVQPPTWVVADADESPAAPCAAGCCAQAKAAPGHAASDNDGNELLIRATCGARHSGESPAVCHASSRSCCQQASNCCSSAATAGTVKKQQAAAGWLNVIQAQKCSGQTLDWIVAGATVPPSLPVRVEADAAAVWMEPAPEMKPQSPTFRPDAPPPRPVLVC